MPLGKKVEDLNNSTLLQNQRGARSSGNREPKQPRRRRQQKPHKFAYLTMKNSIFARFARAFFIFWNFVDVLVLSTTWNDLFCSCVDDVSIWWQMFNFVFLCPKRWFQFNSRIVRTHFSSIMSLNNWKMFAETRSHIFRWRSRFRRRRVCLSSLITSVHAYWNFLLTFLSQTAKKGKSGCCCFASSSNAFNSEKKKKTKTAIQQTKPATIEYLIFLSSLNMSPKKARKRFIVEWNR